MLTTTKPWQLNSAMPFERLDQIVRIGKQYLEKLLKPVNPAYECVAFRAANWAVSPSRNVVRALVKNGFRIETSVFKYGRRNGPVSFDYSNAHSNLIPWPVDEEDICRRNDAGKLVEVPIYCEQRWIGAFLTPSRIYRARQTRAHSVANDFRPARGEQPVTKSSILDRLSMFTRLHPWKADFNQCTGRQLIRALKRAETRHGAKGIDLPFVLIGHSKLFTARNEQSLEPFLSFVAQNQERFGFARLSDVANRGNELWPRSVATGSSRSRSCRAAVQTEWAARRSYSSTLSGQ
jgi:hypothetical protein